MQQRLREDHLVERADVPLQLVGGLAVRVPGVRGGPGGAPGDGTGPGVQQRPGPGQYRRTAQDQPSGDGGQQGGLEHGDQERVTGHGDEVLGTQARAGPDTRR